MKEHEYVAMHAPIFAAAYASSPKHLAEAMDYVCGYLNRYPALLAAMQARDSAEVGLQLQLAMDARLAEVADDDAFCAWSDLYEVAA